MPERSIRPRRPVAWNQLLRKGHVHRPRKSGGRSAARAAIEEGVARYLDDAVDGDSVRREAPPESSADEAGDPRRTLVADRPDPGQTSD